MKLNNIIKDKCEEVWKSSEIVFELNPSTNIFLPRDYFINFFIGFANITDEIELYRGRLRKVETGISKNNIQINLLSSGNHLEKDIIDNLNDSYQGEQIHTFKQSGSFWIGEYF